MLEAELGSKVTSNNQSIRFKEKAGESGVALRDALEVLRTRSAPTTEDCARFAMGEQPKRFSKFDPCLPEDLLAQLVVESSLDVPSARRAIGIEVAEVAPKSAISETVATEDAVPVHAHTPAKRIKCLSIRPAWAWMIIHLQAPRWKDVENRSWTTKYRGPLLIHASQGLTHDEYEEACALALSAGRADASQLPTFRDMDLIRGRLIGAVQLSNVAPPGKVVSPWHDSDSYGWQLADRVAFSPRALAGKLSLYEVEPTPDELATLQAAGFL
jgi:hypothetical protein